MSTPSTPAAGAAAGGHGRGGPTAPIPGDRIRPKKPARVQFASTTLLLEAFVLVFATLAAYGLRTVPSLWPGGTAPSAAVVWAVGAVFVVVLLVLSCLVSAPGGYLAGTLVQVPVIATGFAVPMMFLLGGIFAVLWLVALRLGGRIDRERAAYDEEHPETAPNV